MKSGRQQTAEAAGPDGSGNAIGRVETVSGEVQVTHLDGSKQPLAHAAPIHQGDLIETGADAKISLLFADQSTFALGSDARMVMDEFVYDPKSEQGHSLETVAKGVFVFVSGEIAAHNPGAMEVHTPVFNLGVRGTKVAGVANPEGQENKIALLADDHGKVGTLLVKTGAGSVVLDTANQLTHALFANLPPAVPEIVEQIVIDHLFGETLKFLPFLSEINAATGLLDTLGHTLFGGSETEQKNDTATPAENGTEKKDEGGVGGFFDSILPNAGSDGSAKPGDGSRLDFDSILPNAGSDGSAKPGDGSWLDSMLSNAGRDESTKAGDNSWRDLPNEPVWHDAGPLGPGYLPFDAGIEGPGFIAAVDMLIFPSPI
jgi:hypothetical protein